VTAAAALFFLQRGNANVGGSYLEQGRQQYLIRGIGLLRTPDEIGSIGVAERNGVPILVKHVAQVSLDRFTPGRRGPGRRRRHRHRHRADAQGENPSQVLKAVKEKVDALTPRCLPRT